MSFERWEFSHPGPSLGSTRMPASYSPDFDREPHLMQARPRILVVDPDADTRVILSLGLGHAGYGVEAVPTGGAALDALERGVPHAVISELWMSCGGMGCVLHYMRSRPELADVPLIAHTALATKEAVEWAKAARVNAVFVKPERIERLADTLRALQRKAD
jgi:CheY-like chemotaxis protein